MKYVQLPINYLCFTRKLLGTGKATYNLLLKVTNAGVVSLHNGILNSN